jgi:hypothetical protein
MKAFYSLVAEFTRDYRKISFCPKLPDSYITDPRQV